MTDLNQNGNNGNNGDLEGVKRRIRKLIAMAEDGRGNEHEAANAAAMAEKLMRKYQIDHADVIVETLRKGDGMSESRWRRPKSKRVVNWAQWIAVQLAELHDAGVRIVRGHEGDSLEFVGFEADVEMCVFSMDYLSRTVDRLVDAYSFTPTGMAQGRSALTQYRSGVAIGITNNLMAAIAAKAEEAQQANSSSTALVIAKVDAITEKYGQNIRKYKTTKSRRRTGQAFYDGINDGSDVDVNRRGLNGNGNTAALTD